MRLLYLTAKHYPGGTADHDYVKRLARALYEELDQNFLFVACNTQQNALPGLPLHSVFVPKFLKRTIVMFFWVPWYWYTYKAQRPSVFFSNDFNLLLVLIFWKKTLSLPYLIVSDWHLMSNTAKDARVLAGSDLCITTSQGLSDALAARVATANIETIYGGVELDGYVPAEKSDLRQTLQLPANSYLVGYIGLFTTMGMEKGILTMLDALTLLPKEVHMVFVGGRSGEIERYKKYAYSKGIEMQTTFVALQAFNRVVEYQQAMDTVMIPYPDQPHFREFGFPMKVYEYMASKTPIIYTMLPLAHEMLSDCAFSVTPDDPRSFADMINYLREHPVQAASRAQAAFEKVKHLTWREKAQRIIHTIEKLHA